MRHLFLLFSSILSVYSAAQESLKGMVIDSNSKAPLPYSTIIFDNGKKGVTSNESGEFHLVIDSIDASDSLQVSYVAYESKTIPIDLSDINILVELTPSAFQLDEVIIRPIEPAEYLRMVKRRQRENNAIYSFNAWAHYEEAIRENDELIDHSEGIFKSWFSDYQLNSEIHHQLILFRKKPVNQLEFMKARAKKEKAKYLEEYPEEQADEDDLLLTNFGGPESIMRLNVMNESLECLDSTRAKNFRYHYLPETSYLGKNIVVIGYESKGVVDNKRQTGKIYVDAESMAIVSLEEEGELVIPVIAKPILFVMGLRVRRPRYIFSLKYRPINGKWYPQFTRWDIYMHLTKKHAFKKNEKASFAVDQFYSVDNIDTENIFNIPKGKRFDPEKKMDEQVYPEEGKRWSDFLRK